MSSQPRNRAPSAVALGCCFDPCFGSALCSFGSGFGLGFACLGLEYAVETPRHHGSDQRELNGAPNPAVPLPCSSGFAPLYSLPSALADEVRQTFPPASRHITRQIVSKVRFLPTRVPGLQANLMSKSLLERCLRNPSRRGSVSARSMVLYPSAGRARTISSWRLGFEIFLILLCGSGSRTYMLRHHW